MDLAVYQLGLCDYQTVWQRMQQLTRERDQNTVDQLWLLQHHPVFTQGVSGKADHILDAHDIPVVQSNRGGQVTYHAPGQIVMYVLLDIRRKGIGVRQLVTYLEASVIELMAGWGLNAESRADAPGVYFENQKVAALGLRVSRGCSYHGLSLNVDMDLTPFSWINPCGYQGLQVTQLKNLGVEQPIPVIEGQLTQIFADKLGYNPRPTDSD